MRGAGILHGVVYNGYKKAEKLVSSVGDTKPKQTLKDSNTWENTGGETHKNAITDTDKKTANK